MAQNDEPDVSEEDVGAPPEADSVALRLLAAAALLRRLELERAKAQPGDFAALGKWVDESGLVSSLGPAAVELFDAAPGAWSDDDREAAAWAAEELAMLSWALGRAETPPPLERASAEALLKAVPVGTPAEPFSLQAKLRPLDAVDAARALQETLLAVTQAEAWARALLADPSLAEGDDEEQLEEVLAEAQEDGFDHARALQERGKAAAAALGLRHWTQARLAELFGPGTPHRAVAFPPERLAALDDESLAVALAAARLRADALAWLAEGDDWDFGDEDGGAQP